MKTKTASIIIGVTFILVGIIGFTDNPLVGHSALFHTDVTHNLVHIISGALFLIVAFAMPQHGPLFHKIFGIVYFLLGILGLFMIGTEGEGKLLGFLHVNGPDNFLHIGLGLVIYLTGMMGSSSQTVVNTNSNR